MKITIVSSMTFAKEIVQSKEYLEKKWHTVWFPPNTYSCLDDMENSTTLEFCIKNNLLAKCFERIEKHDAILVLNYEKNWIKWYVWGASLMEIWIAYYLKKKIFILNQLPSENDLKYVWEIYQAKPIILSGNLDLINDN